MKRLGLLSGLIILFLWSPLVRVAAKGMSVEAFTLLFTHAQIMKSLGQSLFLGVCSACISTLMGTLTAFALPRLPGLRQKLVASGLIFPMVLPEIAIGLSFLVWFIKLGIPLGWGTLISSHVAFSFSYTTLIMKTRVETLDRSLMDAARDLGAGRWHVFRHALLPQLAPGLAASLVTAFSLSLDDFLITYFVKGLDQMTLPIQIYSMLKVRIGPEIYALSLILFCISIVAVLLSQIWLHARKTSQLRSPSAAH